MKSKYFFVLERALPKTELNSLFAFMGKHGITHFPYTFSLKYKHLKPQVLFDAIQGLHYVLHNSKKLYFPQGYDITRIQDAYKYLLLEQDIESPHRYVESYNSLSGCTLLDVGAAEGIFTLDTIEQVQHVYLFECDEKWIKALNATFAPWPEKVSIIKKYVSNKVDAENVTIDSFLQDKTIKSIFLKMDVEGYEQAVLQGAEHSLTDSSISISCSICTYHRAEDADKISNTLSRLGFVHQFTQGYIFFNKGFQKGVIRGHKA